MHDKKLYTIDSFKKMLKWKIEELIKRMSDKIVVGNKNLF